MKRFIGLLTILVLVGTSLTAQSAPIRISLEQDYNQFSQMYSPTVVITGVTNSITIKNMILNRGNCTYRKEELVPDSKSSNGLSVKNIFPKTLNYGEKMKITISKKCNVLAIDVETNQGDWSVEY